MSSPAWKQFFSVVLAQVGHSRRQKSFFAGLGEQSQGTVGRSQDSKALGVLIQFQNGHLNLDHPDLHRNEGSWFQTKEQAALPETGD